MVRRQAQEDLEHMKHELERAKSNQSHLSSRDVDEVAALQASRQEMLSLQQSLNEKDHLLRLSQSQCRSLEDSVEDRDKEVDQLKRKLELLLRKAGGLEANTASVPETPEAASPISEPGKGSAGSRDDKRNSLGRLFRRK
jgi:chromosome segregation ATPase